MKIINKIGREDIAVVYTGEFVSGKRVEFVESLQPPIPREKKWVIIVSTLFGCPVKCKICDAGVQYSGKLNKEQILAQIDYIITKRYPNRIVPVDKLKIQFARMGEPAFNIDVLNAMKSLDSLYISPCIIPAISTIAPKGTEQFFEQLLNVKNEFFEDRFQLQFSIHTTDIQLRDWLIPLNKWDFLQIAEYGNRFYTKNNRKITLNFALADNMPIDAKVLLKYFDPQVFFLKITPINPTSMAKLHDLKSHVVQEKSNYDIILSLREAGYEVLLSIGEWEENKIGSNCGQYINKENCHELYAF